MLLKRKLGVILSCLILVSCAGNLSPNASPEAKVKFKKLQVVTALSDFQDGVIAANHATWLSDTVAVATVTAIQVGLDAVEVAPDPKAIALKVIEDIRKNVTDPKLIPYLNSVKAVVEAL
jgi:hypothetical protein